MKKVFLWALFAGILLANEQIKIPNANFLDTLKLMSTQKESKSANFLLGVMYLNGDKDIKQDIPKAIEHFKKDAKNLSYANYMLGFIAANGYGDVEPNYKQAIDHFTDAFRLTSAVDNKEVGPVALAAIGNIYLNNLHQPKEALAFLLQASKLKNMPNVDFVIAMIYHTSKTVKNEQKAEYYLNKAYNNASEQERAYMNQYVEGGESNTNTKEGSCFEQL